MVASARADSEARYYASVEDMRDSQSEVVVPLSTTGAGQPVTGRRYIRDFTYDM